MPGVRVVRLTLRAACWLHYFEREAFEAAAAVASTGVSFPEAFALTVDGVDHRPRGIWGSDAEHSA